MRASVEFLGRVTLEEGLRRQAGVARGLLEDERGPAVLLLEHEHVYTVGRAGVLREFPPGDPARVPSAIRLAPPPVELDRGGDVTWHGPGQLVVYPVLHLKRMGLALVDYVRALERSAVAALAEFDVRAGTRKGLTGVWTGDGDRAAKLGSIGVGCRRWVTRHGMSLNVSPDLSAFEAIAPCGLRGVRVTSVAEVMEARGLRREDVPSPEEVGLAVARALAGEVGLDLAPLEATPEANVA